MLVCFSSAEFSFYIVAGFLMVSFFSAIFKNVGMEAKPLVFCFPQFCDAFVGIWDTETV